MESSSYFITFAVPYSRFVIHSSIEWLIATLILLFLITASASELSYFRHNIKLYSCFLYCYFVFKVLVVIVNVPSTVRLSTIAVFVMWDGEEIFAITLVVLVLGPTVQATESAILLLTFARVTKAGLATGAKSPTVQDLLTALNEDYATPLWIPLSAKTAPRAGWDRPATILVYTVNRFQWTVVTAFVNQGGLA